jgi:ATP-binding cassette subfamily B (MDR/TAP) protein 1
MYSLYMLLISIGGYFAVAIRGICFNIWTTRLVNRLKKKLFERFLKMSTQFYDRMGNCSAILSDCQSAAQLIHHMFWGITENTTVLVVGLTIAFVSCWQVTLVSLAVLPVLLLAGKLQIHFTQGFSN